MTVSQQRPELCAKVHDGMTGKAGASWEWFDLHVSAVVVIRRDRH
jgi:hypothetical protein